MRILTHLLVFISMLAGSLLLSGCGIKGPLFYPSEAIGRPAPADIPTIIDDINDSTDFPPEYSSEPE